MQEAELWYFIELKNIIQQMKEGQASYAAHLTDIMAMSDVETLRELDNELTRLRI